MERYPGETRPAKIALGEMGRGNTRVYAKEAEEEAWGRQIAPRC
tara:strand:- start:2157 stop:2288 length:132 start_codon:yes stop_codon:yes gene_type:complete